MGAEVRPIRLEGPAVSNCIGSAVPRPFQMVSAGVPPSVTPWTPARSSGLARRHLTEIGLVSGKEHLRRGALIGAGCNNTYFSVITP